MDPDTSTQDVIAIIEQNINTALTFPRHVAVSLSAALGGVEELRRRLSDEEAERLRGELARVRVEAAQARHDALSHAVRRATGCLDYLGGLTGPGSEALLREYHAGMGCVIRVLEGLRDGEDTTQTRALDAIGGAR